ncbi:MAG: M23 family metallopeptidase [Spirochaetia bacterium]|nr:M23 family metallopeptidase [Spirochaetia bacterium]
MSYENPEIQSLREEVKENLMQSARGKTINLVFRKYVLKKKDTFFTVMAKTMLDHDSLSSINHLASLWDVEPGAVWLIPNMRGVAVYGSPDELCIKYKTSVDSIFPVPGSRQLFFITGRSLEPSERSYLNGTVFLKPVKGFISSKFGARMDPFSKKEQFHKGVDIACPTGSEIVASASGKIIFEGEMADYGKLIIIEHSNGYRTLYGHLQSFAARINQSVKKGDKIALSGETGHVTGPHLHFEVRRKGQPQRPRMLDGLHRGQ